jgi:hypothetical protein
MTCLACGKPIESESPLRRLCDACRTEQDATLRNRLTSFCKADEDPLRKLYGPPDKPKPDTPAGF